MTKAEKALRAVLLFYTTGPWTTHQHLRWQEYTDCREATTVGLCDCVRAALEAMDKEAFDRAQLEHVRRRGPFP
jgi:hypothetical protein